MLGSYTLVLAVALAVAAHVRASPRALAAGGSLVFAAASLACGLAGSLGMLLGARSLQAAGAAALLVGTFALVDGGGAGRRAWTGAAIFGFAAGPALGGVLTQAIDWRAIFLAQVPVAIAAAVVAWRSRTVIRDPARTPASWPTGPAVALALLSAALVGVLFLLVLMLVTGWSVSPLAAAAAVSVLPLAALAASRVGGPARVRASAGAVLVGGGVLALASLPNASPWWTVVPQLMAGAGMGLALPALAGELLPERTLSQAARLLSVRHAGITIALALLAPVAATQLDSAVADTREQGAALVLDAQLPPLDKLSLAASLVGDLDPVDPRGELQSSLASARAGVEGDDRAAYAALAERADDALVAGVQDAFEPALAICGVLALLAAAAAFPRERRGRGGRRGGRRPRARRRRAPGPAGAHPGADPHRRPVQPARAPRLERARGRAPGHGADRPRSRRMPLRLLARGARAGARRRRRPRRLRARVRGRPAERRRPARRDPGLLTSYLESR